MKHELLIQSRLCVSWLGPPWLGQFQITPLAEKTAIDYACESCSPVKCETAPAIFGRTYFIFIVVVVVVVIFHMRVGMSSLVKIQHFSSSAKIQENNINLFSNDNGMIRAQIRSNPQWVEHIDHVTLAHHKHAHFEIEGCPEECHNEISSVCWKKSRP